MDSKIRDQRNRLAEGPIEVSCVIWHWSDARDGIRLDVQWISAQPTSGPVCGSFGLRYMEGVS